MLGYPLRIHPVHELVSDWRACLRLPQVFQLGAADSLRAESVLHCRGNRLLPDLETRPAPIAETYEEQPHDNRGSLDPEIAIREHEADIRRSLNPAEESRIKKTLHEEEQITVKSMIIVIDTSSNNLNPISVCREVKYQTKSDKMSELRSCSPM